MSDSRLPDVDSTRRANGAEIAVAHAAQLAAIIVLFHPDWEFVLRNLARLAGQVGNIVLVDNTPDPSPPIEPLRDNVVLITLAENTGIAHAQNVGAAEAERRGARYLVFFDQDSEIGETLVVELLDALKTLVSLGEFVAAVGPRPFDVTKGQTHTPLLVNIDKVGDRFTRVHHLIASGSLIPVAAFHVVGPMDASLFIDSVDHEWCFRAYQRGYSVFIDESIVMRHTVGSGTIGFLGFRVRDTAPSRLYYQFRNQIRLILHYPALAVPRGWRLKRLVALPLKSIAHVLLGDNRRMRLDAIFDGIMAGLRNQTGRRPDTRE